MVKKERKAMKINWVRKLTSRKLWMAVALFVSGVITASGNKEMAETVAGLIMQGAAVLAYIIGEGLVDGANKEAGEVIPYEQTQAIGFTTDDDEYDE